MHGEFGEDGVMQGFLDTIGIPYTGSGILASAAGMNKIVSKKLYESEGLTTPPSSLFGKYHSSVTIETLIEKHAFPCFVKCPQSGSSRLLARVQNREELEQCLKEFSQHANELLIESAVSGEEYSCPVLEFPDGSLTALSPILIKPVSASFFDYTAKYATGGSEEIVPAPCSEELTRRIQTAAVKAHTILNCSGLSRTDMIVANDILYILETNTLPGLTPASLAPKAFAVTGKSYADLLDILIETALAKGH